MHTPCGHVGQPVIGVPSFNRQNRHGPFRGLARARDTLVLGAVPVDVREPPRVHVPHVRLAVADARLTFSFFKSRFTPWHPSCRACRTPTRRTARRRRCPLTLLDGKTDTRAWACNPPGRPPSARTPGCTAGTAVAPIADRALAVHLGGGGGGGGLGWAGRRRRARVGRGRGSDRRRRRRRRWGRLLRKFQQRGVPHVRGARVPQVRAVGDSDDDQGAERRVRGHECPRPLQVVRRVPRTTTTSRHAGFLIRARPVAPAQQLGRLAGDVRRFARASSTPGHRRRCAR